MILSEGFLPERLLEVPGPLTLANVPGGAVPLVLAETARKGRPVVYVTTDGQHIADLQQMLSFAAPEIPVLTVPGWDCLPYDRVSPSSDTTARRLSALSSLIVHAEHPHPAIVLISANALVQKVPPRDEIRNLRFAARPGNQVRMEAIVARLALNGFERVPTVREVGEFAVRGGILDVFVPGDEEPLRLDFFGDTLESIRNFDPASQRTTGKAKALELHPMSEVTLNEETISRFRSNYLSLFGAAPPDDALYRSVSEGRRFAGMEHWLPLFYERLETVFDYLQDFSWFADHDIQEAAGERYAQIVDHFEARKHAPEQSARSQATPYNPVEPQSLYLEPDALSVLLTDSETVWISPFAEEKSAGRDVINLEARAGKRWASTASGENRDDRVNVFDQVVRYVAERRAGGSKILVTAWSEGALDRLLQVLAEHGLERIRSIGKLSDLDTLAKGEAASAVLNLESGFETGDLVVVGEQDILGDRLVRRS